MPGSTLPNMLITLPSLGGDEGIWDDELNAALSLIDVHDHTIDKGARIPTAGLNINANLSMGGFALTSTGSVDFQAVAALAAGTKRLFVNSADNELYWRTNAGTNVKLTSGTSINTSLVGGIVGDYASVGAEVAYDDANDRYTFKQQGSKPWARIASGPLRIYEFNTTETIYVELIAPAALASSYTITLPTAAPGAQAFLQMSTSGVISASNTIAQNVTATDFRHTSVQTLEIPASAMVANGASNTIGSGGTSGCLAWWILGNSTQKLTAPVVLKDGDTISAFSVFANKTTNTSTTIAARLYKVRCTSGTIETESLVGSGASSNANAPGAVLVGESGLTEVVDNNFAYYIMIGYTAVVSFSDHILKVSINFTRP